MKPAILNRDYMGGEIEQVQPSTLKESDNTHFNVVIWSVSLGREPKNGKEAEI